MIPNYQLTQAKRSMNFFIQRSIKSRTSCSLPRTLSTQCDNNWLKIFTKIFINEWTNQFLEVCYILFHFFEQCTKITKSCCSCWSMCSQIWWWVNIGHGVTLAEQQKKYSPQEPRTNWGINWSLASNWQKNDVKDGEACQSRQMDVAILVCRQFFLISKRKNLKGLIYSFEKSTVVAKWSLCSGLVGFWLGSRLGTAHLKTTGLVMLFKKRYSLIDKKMPWVLVLTIYIG